MKRGIVFLLLGILLLIIQNSILMGLPILGAKIDLVLVFIVCISMLLDKIELFFLSLVIGIIKDAFFPYVFGVNTIIYLIVSYTVCIIENKIYKDTIIIPMLFTFASNIFKILINILFFNIAGIIHIDWNKIINLGVIEIALNSVLSIVVYNLVKKIYLHDSMKKEWKF